MGSAAGAPLHDLVRGKLVGRAAELTQLRQHWDQAQQARGHLVLLSGEPGVGKTRLAQELIAHARQGGATILRGGCYEYEATTPYLPFVEAFREWVHGQGIEQLRAKLGTTAAEMAKFAPEIETKLGTLVPNAPLSPGEERLRLFDNAAPLLAVARGGLRPARVHRRHPLGGPWHAVACCTICCATCATTACSSSRRTARSSSIARIRSRRRWSTGTASAWRRALRSDACRRPTRAR